MGSLAKIWERWVVLPYAAFLLLTAEYSRYLTLTEWTHILFAPRTLLLIGLCLMLVWFVLKKLTRQEVFTLSDLWWLGVPMYLAVWSVFALRWSSTALGADPTGYLTNFWLYGLFLVLIIAVLGRDKKNFKILLAAAMLGAIGVIGIGLWEKITDTHLALSNLNNPYRQQWSVTSVFIGQNHLAASLAVFLPIMAGWALSLRRRWRYLVLLAVLGGAIVLFYTGSTLGLMALLLSAIVFMAVVILRRTPGGRAKKISRVVAGIFGTMALASVIWIALPEDIQVRFSLAAIGVQQSIGERTELIKMAWSIMRENFWQGVGPDGAEVMLRSFQTTNIKSLHNLVLEVGVTFGVLALLIFLVWYSTQTWKLLKRSYDASIGEWIGIGLLAALASFIFWQSAPSTFDGVRALFLLFGLSVATITQRCKRIDVSDASLQELRNFRDSISVVIPAYNEAKRIPKTLHEVYSFLNENVQAFEVLIVNDGSRDDTAKVITALIEDMPKARLIDYFPNRGKGFAVRRGLNEARSKWILFMDADHSTSISELCKLPHLAKLGGDIFVSSRYLQGSNIKARQPFMRIIVSRIANLVIRILVPGIRDTQNGFKIIKARSWKKIAPLVTLSRWAFDVEILYLIKKFKYHYLEFPVEWSNSNDSKVDLRQVLIGTSVEYMSIVRNVLFRRYRKREVNTQKRS